MGSSDLSLPRLLNRFFTGPATGQQRQGHDGDCELVERIGWHQPGHQRRPRYAAACRQLQMNFNQQAMLRIADIDQAQGLLVGQLRLGR